MILNRPSFPISFTFEQTASTIEKVIKNNYWTEFSFASIKLRYVPYWFFNFDIFIESVHPERKEKVVADHKSESIAMNAMDGILNEGVASLMSKHKPERIKEPEQGYEFEVVSPLITEQKFEQLAKIRLAKKFEVGLNNVVISGQRMIYVPEWMLTVTVAEGNYQFNISAVDGQIMNEIEGPIREKGWIEVSKETISELKRPGAWAEYSQELFSSAANSNKGFGLEKIEFNQRTLLIILFGILIVVVVLAYFGII